MASHLIHRNPFSPFSSSSLSSLPSSTTTIPWISPLQFLKPATPKSDPPPPPTTLPEQAPSSRRPSRYISHDAAIHMINREANPQRALEIFNKVSEQRGFNHNHSTYSAILHKLACFKKFEAVQALLRQMSFEACKFQEGIFLNLMTHYYKSSLPEKILESFYAIQPLVREKPSLKALSSCLNLLVESGRFDLTQQLLSESRKRFHMEPNTCINNILVKHHCKNGDLASAFKLIEKMRKAKATYPNLITYSTLIGGLCDEGRLKEAFELFEEMISKDKFVPDALTYNLFINAFCKNGRVDKAKEILAFMRRNGCEPNVFNYSALMNGLSKEGKLEEAKELFEEMRESRLEPDVVSYTTLISCLCRVGKSDEGIELITEMREKGIRADVVTSNVVIRGLCSEGRFQEAMELLEKSPSEGLKLNKASYRIVINYLCREGEMERAVALLGLMLGRRILPHFATSNELLIRLCATGKVSDATMALFGLAEMGFRPEIVSWVQLVKSVSRERKLKQAFELLDDLTIAGLSQESLSQGLSTFSSCILVDGDDMIKCGI